jgi:hypothetical protein
MSTNTATQTPDNNDNGLKFAVYTNGTNALIAFPKFNVPQGTSFVQNHLTGDYIIVTGVLKGIDKVDGKINFLYSFEVFSADNGEPVPMTDYLLFVNN